MTLIKSISGIRGTIGGKTGEGLSPADVLKYVAAYITWLKSVSDKKKLHLILGRDARLSGEMVRDIVTGTITGLGVNVTDIGFATTPTVEMEVIHKKADGGIIITASHNPKQWNALKLLNNKGEFLSSDDGEKVLSIAEKGDFVFAEVDQLGSLKFDSMALNRHIEKILAIPLVDVKAIKSAGLKVAIDCVNSVGGIAVPELLDALGVRNIEKIYCEPTGIFGHNPEPLPENLADIAKLVQKTKSDVGFVVDPDVDRLAIICEDGEMFGEEYTLVAVFFSTLGSIVGSLISYYMGYYGGRPIVDKYGKYLLLNHHHLELTEKYFTKKGELTIFISRFIPVVRHLISIPAGMGKMNIWKFSIYTIVGAALWNAFLTYVGMLLKDNWNEILKYSSVIDIVIVIALVILIIYTAYKLFKARNKNIS